jgi:hypothetical protein
MPTKLLNRYLEQLPKLLAEQELRLANAVSLGSTPQSKKQLESQKKAVQALQKTAYSRKTGKLAMMNDELKATHFTSQGLEFEVWKPKEKKADVS